MPSSLPTATDAQLDDVFKAQHTSEPHHFSDNYVVDASDIGKRYDQIAALAFSDFSREKLKEWMLNGALTVDGALVKPKQRAQGGEQFVLDVVLESTDILPEDIPITIVYEDDALLIVNKPAGLVVHPGNGNARGTLVNALVFHRPQLAVLPRAGLVHRIDKDTTGLLVVAKTLPAQIELAAQLLEKTVYRKYDAIALGNVTAGGCIEAPIGRHARERTKMAVTSTGKDAITHYNVVERFDGYTLIRAELETGRTHQIRVHMAHIGHPLLGDALYNPKAPHSKLPESVYNAVSAFKRQALHAQTLGLTHPTTKQHLEVSAPWPDDFAQLVEILRKP